MIISVYSKVTNRAHIEDINNIKGVEFSRTTNRVENFFKKRKMFKIFLTLCAEVLTDGRVKAKAKILWKKVRDLYEYLFNKITIRVKIFFKFKALSNLVLFG